MKQNILILDANNWSMTDQETKQLKTGLSFHYLMTESLDPVSGSDPNKLGYELFKGSMDASFFKNLKSVPGIYEADISFVSSKGKAVIKVNDFSFLREFSSSVVNKK